MRWGERQKTNSEADPEEAVKKIGVILAEAVMRRMLIVHRGPGRKECICEDSVRREAASWSTSERTRPDQQMFVRPLQRIARYSTATGISSSSVARHLLMAQPKLASSREQSGYKENYSSFVTFQGFWLANSMGYLGRNAQLPDSYPRDCVLANPRPLAFSLPS